MPHTAAVAGRVTSRPWSFGTTNAIHGNAPIAIKHPGGVRQQRKAREYAERECGAEQIWRQDSKSDVTSQQPRPRTIGRRLHDAVNDHRGGDRFQRYEQRHQQDAAGHAKHARQHAGQHDCDDDDDFDEHGATFDRADRAQINEKSECSEYDAYSLGMNKHR